MKGESGGWLVCICYLYASYLPDRSIEDWLDWLGGTPGQPPLHSGGDTEDRRGSEDQRIRLPLKLFYFFGGGVVKNIWILINFPSEEKCYRVADKVENVEKLLHIERKFPNICIWRYFSPIRFTPLDSLHSKLPLTSLDDPVLFANFIVL